MTGDEQHDPGSWVSSGEISALGDQLEVIGGRLDALDDDIALAQDTLSSIVEWQNGARHALLDIAGKVDMIAAVMAELGKVQEAFQQGGLPALMKLR